MKKTKKIRRPKNISKADWDSVDVPELSAEELRQMRPAREVVPEIVEAYLRTRSTSPENNKILISIRLSPAVLTHFKATGAGWQTRLDNA
ncbi:MAG: BrnA antitoxin family protein, partial [Proteobacteria bacterium]|nr:BrnA antitoxin family protein [Pseudomonadota bacterium]